jgi:16S rRNA (guanine527-N7)-methyltransferase
MEMFQQELNLVLPPDLPRRQQVIAGAARHLELITEANRHFNLTRLVTPREAAIKHVLDSLIPHRLFAGAPLIIDAGTGAGFPGIPLALLLPEQEFILVDSTQKKAHFVETVVQELELRNVHVDSRRAEDVARRIRAGVLTARAVAPVAKAVTLFGSAVRGGLRALLYKGPDVDKELSGLRPARLQLNIVMRYELPDSMGTRTMVEMRGSA